MTQLNQIPDDSINTMQLFFLAWHLNRTELFPKLFSLFCLFIWKGSLSSSAFLGARDLDTLAKINKAKGRRQRAVLKRL